VLRQTEKTENGVSVLPARGTGWNIGYSSVFGGRYVGIKGE